MASRMKTLKVRAGDVLVRPKGAQYVALDSGQLKPASRHSSTCIPVEPLMSDDYTGNDWVTESDYEIVGNLLDLGRVTAVDIQAANIAALVKALEAGPR